ncbi:DNA-3-methyladenine glycosylase I, partial [bacterium]|nr:DNA-3-methyladenine glycosylase I [bacterium]
MKSRCSWAGNDPLYQKYHDEEWGVPVHDDQKLFEMLCLEGAQAGLSWITILRKRENYQKAFSNFDAKKIAKYNFDKVEKLLQNEGIVRNKLKV